MQCFRFDEKTLFIFKTKWINNCYYIPLIHFKIGKQMSAKNKLIKGTAFINGREIKARKTFDVIKYGMDEFMEIKYLCFGLEEGG